LFDENEIADNGAEDIKKGEENGASASFAAIFATSEDDKGRSGEDDWDGEKLRPRNSFT